MSLTRIGVGLAILLLSGCARSGSGPTGLHVEANNPEQGRQIAKTIYEKTEQFGPLILYDQKSRNINVVFTKPIAVGAARRILADDVKNIQNGIIDASAEYMALASCMKATNCTMDRVTKCKFRSSISPDQFNRLYSRFEKEFMQGGYPAAGVLFSYHAKDPEAYVVVHYYEQCNSGISDVKRVWSTLGISPNVVQDGVVVT